jgi:ketosteroid isomerase-like protein
VNNVDLIRGLYEAFARGDIEAVLAALDEQVEWTEVEGFPHGGTYVGPQAVLEGVFAPLGRDWDSFTADMSEFLDAGDHVVAIGRYRGTFRPTGASLDAEGAVVWTVRDGKVIRFRQYVDTAALHLAAAAPA